MIWDIRWEGRHAPGVAGMLRTVFLPTVAGIVAGLILIAFAGSLARIATRGVE
jgi:hypothetical protein